MCSLFVRSYNTHFFNRTRQHDGSPPYKYDTSDVESAQQEYLRYKMEQARDRCDNCSSDYVLRRKYKAARENYLDHKREVSARHGK